MIELKLIRITEQSLKSHKIKTIFYCQLPWLTVVWTMDKIIFSSVCSQQLFDLYMTRVCYRRFFWEMYSLKNIYSFNAEVQMFHNNVEIYNIWLIFTLCVCLGPHVVLVEKFSWQHMGPHKISFLGYILRCGHFLETKIKIYFYREVTTC